MANDTGLLSAPLTKAEAVLFGLLSSVKGLHCGHCSQVSGRLMEPPTEPWLHQLRSLRWCPHSFQKILKTVLKRHQLRKENPSSWFPSSVGELALAKYKVTGREQIYAFILLVHGTVSRLSNVFPKFQRNKHTIAMHLLKTKLLACVFLYQEGGRIIK